jgi:hypothetical protein
MSLSCIVSVMVCPTAKFLLESYTRAAEEHFDATDKLCSLVGQHGRFEDQKEYTERMRQKFNTFRLALEQSTGHNITVVRVFLTGCRP